VVYFKTLYSDSNGESEENNGHYYYYIINPGPPEN
jgi:hypothetical protein